MDRAWYSRIFGPLGAPGELENTFQCPHYEKDFHLKVFTEKPAFMNMQEYFKAEDLREPPATIVDNTLDRVPLPYPISCLLFALTIWLIWALPVSLFGGFAKIVTDIKCLWVILGTALLLLSVKYCSDRVRSFKEPFLRLTKVREYFREWTYYRYAYYILGRPNPPVISPAKLAGTISAIVYIALTVLWYAMLREPLTNLETAPIVGVFQEYTSIASAVAGTLSWTIISFIFGMALWIAIATAWTVNRIGARLPLNYLPLEKTAGVKGLADLAVASLLPLVTSEIEILIFVPRGGEEFIKQAFSPVALGSAVGAVVVTLFLASLSSVHEGVRQWKQRYLSVLSERYGKLTQFPEGSTHLTKKDRVAASSVLAHHDRVASIREWPYDLGILSKVVAIAASAAAVIERLLSMMLSAPG